MFPTLFLLGFTLYLYYIFYIFPENAVILSIYYQSLFFSDLFILDGFYCYAFKFKNHLFWSIQLAVNFIQSNFYFRSETLVLMFLFTNTSSLSFLCLFLQTEYFLTIMGYMPYFSTCPVIFRLHTWPHKFYATEC